LLDGTAIPTTLVNSRDLSATVPASMLGGPRGYVVYVQNSPTALSNVTHLNVIQPVTVGNSPVGVAVDNARDQAVITNSGSGNVSVVDLLTGTVITPQSSSSFLTGASPFGVAVLPRLGLAFVVNHASNSATILDEAGLNGAFAPPVTVPLCGTCVLPTGATINPDTALALFTLQIISSPSNFGELGQVSIAGATPAAAPSASQFPIDLTPLGLAVDPSLSGDPSLSVTVVAAAAGINQSTGAGTSALDFVLSNSGSVSTRVSNLILPTDVVFDPVNQVFLATDSTINNIYIVNPTASVLATIAASINPTSLDYNYNASALVTASSATSTISVIDYVCPPNDGVNCPVPHVQSVFAPGSSVPSSSAVPVGVKAVGVDLRLNLIVEVDEANNRILLVPLQH
jgi:DNA-binding beta-propeller fold protein YncE